MARCCTISFSICIDIWQIHKWFRYNLCGRSSTKIKKKNIIKYDWKVKKFYKIIFFILDGQWHTHTKQSFRNSWIKIEEKVNKAVDLRWILYEYFIKFFLGYRIRKSIENDFKMNKRNVTMFLLLSSFYDSICNICFFSFILWNLFLSFYI